MMGAIMSIKRTKQRTYGSGRKEAPDSPASAKSQAPQNSWSELVEGKPDEAFVPYSLESHFSLGALVQHTKFGRGAVVEVSGPHVVVLFAEGTKKLGHIPG